MATGGILAGEQHLAGIGGLKAGDDPQQRGLAAAGGTEQRDQFAVGKVEADIVEGNVLVELFADIADFDAHDASSRRSSCARHSTRLFRVRVTRASRASSEATAKAAANWYSL